MYHDGVTKKPKQSLVEGGTERSLPSRPRRLDLPIMIVG